MQPSIKVVPVSANSGDTVNVFAQDFSNDNAGFTQLKLAGKDITGDKIARSERNIGSDGSGEVAFKVPGGYEGTLRIDAKWCTSGEDPVCISERHQDHPRRRSVERQQDRRAAQRDHYHHRQRFW